jgi:hypothetical protein
MNFNLEKIISKTEQLIPKNLMMGILATFAAFSAQAQEKHKIDLTSIEASIQNMTPEQRREYVVDIYSKIDSSSLSMRESQDTSKNELITFFAGENDYKSMALETMNPGQGQQLILIDTDSDGDLDIINVHNTDRDTVQNKLTTYLDNTSERYDLRQLSLQQGSDLAKEVEVLNQKYAAALQVLVDNQNKIVK